MSEESLDEIYVHTKGPDNRIHVASCPKVEGKKVWQITAAMAIITLDNRGAGGCGCLIDISAEERAADELIRRCDTPEHVSYRRSCTSIGYTRGYITRNYQQFLNSGHHFEL